MPAIAVFGKQRGRSNQAGHVHVVPAGVRHWHGLAIRTCRCNCTRIGETRSFLDGQRIHVSAQHYGWAVSVAQYTDNSSLADSCGDLKADGLDDPPQSERFVSRAWTIRGGHGCLYRQPLVLEAMWLDLQGSLSAFC